VRPQDPTGARVERDEAILNGGDEAQAGRYALEFAPVIETSSRKSHHRPGATARIARLRGDNVRVLIGCVETIVCSNVDANSVAPF
jgi:hypothetical protein